jgi:hypothetical protein
MTHLNYLSDVANGDVAHIMEKEKTYKGSWKKRGGVGAFMMLARKWDRLENILEASKPPYDVFAAMKNNPSGSDGTILAEVRDLRRYLLLVEAEMVAQGVLDLDHKHHYQEEIWRAGTPEDGGQHARFGVPDPQSQVLFDECDKE